MLCHFDQRETNPRGEGQEARSRSPKIQEISPCRDDNQKNLRVSAPLRSIKSPFTLEPINGHKQV
jgi:hypothetical protein